jgi:hypothetical protein
MVTRLIKEETLHCFIIQSSRVFDSLSVDFLCALYEGKESKSPISPKTQRFVKKLIERLILTGEITGLLDCKESMVMFPPSARTTLDKVAINLSDKAQHVISMTEKMWENKGNPPLIPLNYRQFAGRRWK